MYEKECFYYVTLNDYHVGYEYDEWDCFTRQELEDLRKESAALQAAVNGYKEAVAMAFADGKIEDGTYTIGNYTFIFSNSIDNPIVTGTLNGYYAKVTNGHVEVTTTDPNS